MILHDKAYTALMIVGLFEGKKVTRISIFELEDMLKEKSVSYKNMMVGLMLLYMIGIIDKTGIDIHMIKAINDEQLCGLSKLIVKM